MSTNVSILNKRMSMLRKEKGWTLQELADQLGLSRVTCGYYENEKRHPDSEIIARMCKVFDVSADYLLGLSDTRKPEYAEIAHTTGLTEESIKHLNHAGGSHRNIVNHLFHEEPGIPLWLSESLDPAFEAFLNSPEQIELAYQEHLKQCEWEKRMKQSSILEHVANEWGYNDFIENETEEEYAARTNAEAPKIAAEMAERYAIVDPSEFGSIDAYSFDNEQRIIEEEQRFIQAEARKSNLLTAIANYVAYTSGCTLETATWSEELTSLHSINIGTGRGNSITFPSKQGNELLEFMLLQKVIDALKKFKTNFYESGNQ